MKYFAIIGFDKYTFTEVFPLLFWIIGGELVGVDRTNDTAAQPPTDLNLVSEAGASGYVGRAPSTFMPLEAWVFEVVDRAGPLIGSPSWADLEPTPAFLYEIRALQGAAHP